MPFLYLKAEIFPDLSQRAEVEAAYRELIEASLAEPGCHFYDLVFEEADPSVWYMFEKWESREIWENGHMKSPHVAKIQRIEASLTVKPTILNFYVSAI